MTTDTHRLIIGSIIFTMLIMVSGSALALVIKINWNALPGPEAGIVASIISTVVTGTFSLASSVAGHYFGSSPTQGS